MEETPKFSPDKLPFTPKQYKFIREANAKYNLADGSVRAGKTVGVMFKFLLEVLECPGNMIWMLGNTLDDVYDNCIAIILNADEKNPLRVFRPYLTWHKSGILEFFDKRISVLGARDERALGKIQGKTMDLVYCNEMTLYPPSVLNMLLSRLSMPHSKLYADMNPSYPDHKCKELINLAQSGDPSYYNLHFEMADNTMLPPGFVEEQKRLMSGLFYRRFFLGEWCLAEGAIFDFFDKNIHVDKQMKAVDYWIAGVDYGASNAFACVILGIKKNKYKNDSAYAQVQAEYYYSAKGSRAKTNSEYIDDLQVLFEKYPVRCVYLDPSAASFKAELQKACISVKDTDNEVLAGITLMTDLVARGEVSIHSSCTNLIREIQGYSWDDKASKRGEDAPIKKDDHAVDGLRYALKGILGKRTTFRDATVVSSDQFGLSLGYNPDRMYK